MLDDQKHYQIHRNKEQAFSKFFVAWTTHLKKKRTWNKTKKIRKKYNLCEWQIVNQTASAVIFMKMD